MSLPQEQNSNQQKENNLVDPILQGIKDRSESYTSTIFALHGFYLAVKRTLTGQGDDIKYSIGRRMHYPNGKKKQDHCTPDIVIQLHPNEGIIGEAKLLVCQNTQDQWNKYVQQVKKYDEDLIGWWTNDERIDNVSLIWITDITFSTQLGDYFQGKIDSGDIHYNHPFAVIEYSKHQKSREYLYLRKRLGDMPERLANEFRNGINIPVEQLIVTNRERKFYDAKPQDIEYIMEILWQNIFTQEALDKNGGSRFVEELKLWRIPVQTVLLTKKLQMLYGAEGNKNREVEYPRQTWIKEALEKFVEIGLAERGPQKEEYIILFKKFPRPLEKMVQLIHRKKRRKTDSGKQLPLF